MVKQVLIEQRWMFIKIQKQREEKLYKEKSYNCSIIHWTFFFEKFNFNEDLLKPKHFNINFPS